MSAESEVAATGSTRTVAALKAELVRRARAEGFDIAGITTPGAIGQAGDRLGEFLQSGMHGDMD